MSRLKGNQIFVLVICTLLILPLAFIKGPWIAKQAAIAGAVYTVCALAALGVYDSKRFRWAGRAATGLIFGALLIDATVEVCTLPWQLGGGESPLGSVLRLLLFGGPCLRYACLGRLGSKAELPDVNVEPRLHTICPSCEKPWKDHEWAFFASVLARHADQAQVDRLINRVRAHDWAAVHEFQTRSFDVDMVEVRIARCRIGASALVLWCSAEFEPFQLYFVDTVSSAELREIQAVEPKLSWRKVPA